MAMLSHKPRPSLPSRADGDRWSLAVHHPSVCAHAYCQAIARQSMILYDPKTDRPVRTRPYRCLASGSNLPVDHDTLSVLYQSPAPSEAKTSRYSLAPLGNQESGSRSSGSSRFRKMPGRPDARMLGGGDAAWPDPILRLGGRPPSSLRVPPVLVAGSDASQHTDRQRRLSRVPAAQESQAATRRRIGSQVPNSISEHDSLRSRPREPRSQELHELPAEEPQIIRRFRPPFEHIPELAVVEVAATGTDRTEDRGQMMASSLEVHPSVTDGAGDREELLRRALVLHPGRRRRRRTNSSIGMSMHESVD